MSTNPVLQGLLAAKRIWSKCHPNLWQKERESWLNLDIENVLLTVFATCGGGKIEDTVRKVLSDKGVYCSGLVFPMGFKKVYLKSLKPQQKSDAYERCIENIKKHLDEKKEFFYTWRSYFYDVYVKGSMQDKYVVVLALEYKGKSHGHYYILLNEKFGIHVEDD